MYTFPDPTILSLMRARNILFIKKYAVSQQKNGSQEKYTFFRMDNFNYKNRMKMHYKYIKICHNYV